MQLVQGQAPAPVLRQWRDLGVGAHEAVGQPAEQGERAWLVDPSAHGGHRETDLAMLDLFGGLSDRFVGAYSEVAPPVEGWRRRLPLHQLHPLLVHALLFGGGYGPRAVAVARQLA